MEEGMPQQPVETPVQADNVPPTVETPQQEQPAVNPQEEIGFHKGALNTLIAERNELIKIIGNVDAIMQGHMVRLKELGVDVTNNNTTQ